MESPFESHHFGTRRPGSASAQEELETSDLDALSPSIFSAFWHLHDASLQLSSENMVWCDVVCGAISDTLPILACWLMRVLFGSAPI